MTSLEAVVSSFLRKYGVLHRSYSLQQLAYYHKVQAYAYADDIIN
jgi:hypothetical protein